MSALGNFLIKSLSTLKTDRDVPIGVSDGGDERGALHVFNVNGSGGGATNPNLEVRNAHETLSALKCVYSFDANSVAIADDNTSLLNATVFGVTITAANINESTQILTHGTIRDSSFTWLSGVQLYVGANGALTSTAPITGFRTLVATSQGIGSIFINIQEPIIL